MNKQTLNVKKNQVFRVLLITFVLNLSIALAKLIYGHLSGTLSILADGFHSLMDSSSNIVGFIAISYAYTPPDQEHHYGHRKAEILASFFIAVLLALTCLEILKELIGRWIHPVTPQLTYWAYVIMGVGLLINLGVVRYEHSAAKRLNSHLLASDAEHTRSDIYVTLSVFASLIAIHYQWYFLDSLVSLGIVGIIGKVAYDLMRKNMDILLDRAPLNTSEIRELTLEVEGVYQVHKIRAHGLPDAIYIDLHIWVAPELSVQRAHELAHQVKDKLIDSFSGVIDVTIHIEPNQNNHESKKQKQ